MLKEEFRDVRKRMRSTNKREGRMNKEFKEEVRNRGKT